MLTSLGMFSVLPFSCIARQTKPRALQPRARYQLPSMTIGHASLLVEYFRHLPGLHSIALYASSPQRRFVSPSRPPRAMRRLLSAMPAASAPKMNAALKMTLRIMPRGESQRSPPPARMASRYYASFIHVAPFSSPRSFSPSSLR